MSVSEALLRGRGVYRRLFATEQNCEDGYAPYSEPPEQLYRDSYSKESQFVEAAQVLPLIEDSGNRQVNRYPAMAGAEAPRMFFTAATAESVDSDETLERLMCRMESESRMYSQDFTTI